MRRVVDSPSYFSAPSERATIIAKIVHRTGEPLLLIDHPVSVSDGRARKFQSSVGDLI